MCKWPIPAIKSNYKTITPSFPSLRDLVIYLQPPTRLYGPHQTQYFKLISQFGGKYTPRLHWRHPAFSSCMNIASKTKMAFSALQFRSALSQLRFSCPVWVWLQVNVVSGNKSFSMDLSWLLVTFPIELVWIFMLSCQLSHLIFPFYGHPSPSPCVRISNLALPCLCKTYTVQNLWRVKHSLFISMLHLAPACLCDSCPLSSC